MDPMRRQTLTVLASRPAVPCLRGFRGRDIELIPLCLIDMGPILIDTHGLVVVLHDIGIGDCANAVDHQGRRAPYHMQDGFVAIRSTGQRWEAATEAP